MTAHSKLRKEIVAYLDSIGAWSITTQNRGYGRSGVPDILACAGGKFVAIEVKVAPDKPTKWQERELTAINVAKGQTIVAYSLADVRDVI